MKTKRSHIIRPDGKALCTGRLSPHDESAEPCEKCALSQKRKNRIEKQKEDRRIRIEKRAADLENGVLFQLHSGMFALRYSLEGKTVVQSLGERSEVRANMMAPLAMKHIRRTGRKLRTEPKCYADMM